MTDEVLKKWKEANPKFDPPVILKDTTVYNKISKLKADYAKFTTGKKGPKKSREVFIKNFEKLFNLLHCKCSIMVCSEFGCSDCPEGVHIACSCKSANKIPVSELKFIRLKCVYFFFHNFAPLPINRNGILGKVEVKNHTRTREQHQSSANKGISCLLLKKCDKLKTYPY